MSEELKGCFICGELPDVSKYDTLGKYKIFCDQGDQNHIVVIYGKSKTEAIKNWNDRSGGKTKLDAEKIAMIILDVQESLEKGGRDIRLLQSDRRLIAEAICDRFHPANADRLVALVDGVMPIVESWIPESPAQKEWKKLWTDKAKQSLAKHEKGQVKA